MLTNKGAKILRCHFNDLRERQNLPIYCVKHTIIYQNASGLIELQKQNRSYFI